MTTPAPHGAPELPEPSFDLQRLRFFRDLIAAQRMDVYKAFDAIPAGAEEEVTSHTVENRLFNHIWMGPRGDEFSAAIDAAIASSKGLI